MMGKTFARSILEYNNIKIQKFACQQIETFYKSGGGEIPKWLLDREGNMKGDVAPPIQKNVEKVPTIAKKTPVVNLGKKNAVHLDPISKAKFVLKEGDQQRKHIPLPGFVEQVEK